MYLWRPRSSQHIAHVHCLKPHQRNLCKTTKIKVGEMIQRQSPCCDHTVALGMQGGQSVTRALYIHEILPHFGESQNNVSNINLPPILLMGERGPKTQTCPGWLGGSISGTDAWPNDVWGGCLLSSISRQTLSLDPELPHSLSILYSAFPSSGIANTHCSICLFERYLGLNSVLILSKHFTH